MKTDLHELFRAADRIDAPTDWAEVTSRASRIVVGDAPTLTDRGVPTRRVSTVIVAFLVFVTAGAFAWRAFSPTGSRPGSARGAITRIRLPAAPFARPVVVDGSVWVITGTELVRVSIATNEVTPVPIPGVPSWVEADEDSLWVTACTTDHDGTCTHGVVNELDPSDGRVVASFPAGDDPTRVLANGDTLWIVDNGGDGRVLGIDASTGHVRERSLGARDCCQGLIPIDLAVSAGVLWVQEGTSAVLVRIDPANRDRYPTIGGVTACGVVGDDTAVWAASCNYESYAPQTVWRIDPSTGNATVVQTIEGNPHLELGGGSVWVGSYRADETTAEIRQLDPETGAQEGSTIIVPDDPSLDVPRFGPVMLPIGPFVAFGESYAWLVTVQDQQLVRVAVG